LPATLDTADISLRDASQAGQVSLREAAADAGIAELKPVDLGNRPGGGDGLDFLAGHLGLDQLAEAGADGRSKSKMAIGPWELVTLAGMVAPWPIVTFRRRSATVASVSPAQMSQIRPSIEVAFVENDLVRTVLWSAGPSDAARESVPRKRSSLSTNILASSILLAWLTG
jgi:hypothetical protein